MARTIRKRHCWATVAGSCVKGRRHPPNSLNHLSVDHDSEMCSGSEAGSYLMLIDFVYHSTLGLRVIKKRRRRFRIKQPLSSKLGTIKTGKGTEAWYHPGRTAACPPALASVPILAQTFRSASCVFGGPPHLRGQSSRTRRGGTPPTPASPVQR